MAHILNATIVTPYSTATVVPAPGCGGNDDGLPPEARDGKSNKHIRKDNHCKRIEIQFLPNTSVTSNDSNSMEASNGQVKEANAVDFLVSNSGSSGQGLTNNDGLLRMPNHSGECSTSTKNLISSTTSIDKFNIAPSSHSSYMFDFDAFGSEQTQNISRCKQESSNFVQSTSEESGDPVDSLLNPTYSTMFLTLPNNSSKLKNSFLNTNAEDDASSLVDMKSSSQTSDLVENNQRVCARKRSSIHRTLRNNIRNYTITGIVDHDYRREECFYLCTVKELPKDLIVRLRTCNLVSYPQLVKSYIQRLTDKNSVRLKPLMSRDPMLARILEGESREASGYISSISS